MPLDTHAASGLQLQQTPNIKDQLTHHSEMHLGAADRCQGLLLLLKHAKLVAEQLAMQWEC